MWFRSLSKRPRPSVRLARLRPEFARLYPSIRPNRWVPARKLLRKLRAENEPSRPLGDAHFDFQGGSRRNPEWPALRQRRSDPIPVRRPAGDRIARLRPEATLRYPEQLTGVWRPARQITEEILEARRTNVAGSARPDELLIAPNQRVVPDADFEFQSGISDPGFPRLRTRKGDLLQMDREAKESRARTRSALGADPHGERPMGGGRTR